MTVRNGSDQFSKTPDRKKSGIGERDKDSDEIIGIPKPDLRKEPKKNKTSGITNTNTNTITGGNTEISIGNVGSGSRSKAREKAQGYLNEKDKEDEQIADSNEPSVAEDEGTPNPNYEQKSGKPAPSNVTQQPTPAPGYGGRIGKGGMGTMDFIDSDGDRVDDRYQRGPGQDRIYRTLDKENNNPFTNYRDVFDTGKRSAKGKNQSKGYNFNKGGYDYR